MVDLSLGTINRLFIEQISDLTEKSCKEDTFDQQFSEWWLK